MTWRAPSHQIRLFHKNMTDLPISQTCASTKEIIMLPLLKSFMKVGTVYAANDSHIFLAQAQLEKLIDEDAKQKSETVAEAFLSELALAAEKNTRKGGNPAKLPKETKRANKKKSERFLQYYRGCYHVCCIYFIQVSLIISYYCNLQATYGDELNVVREEKEEESHIPAGHNGYHPSSETGVAVSADELKLQEVELKHKIQFQEEERKLEESLEHLRLIEEEAKQKNLAKQTKDADTLGDDGGTKNDIAVSQPLIHNRNVVLHDSSEIYTGSRVLKLEVERTARGSMMPHQDPLLGKSTMPEDFCRASASCSHDNVQQGNQPLSKARMSIIFLPTERLAYFTFSPFMSRTCLDDRSLTKCGIFSQAS
ncbi:uncharacterized protein LOC130755482 [Actinidia eriantha]|uniref:uncharacterized protein LOC130755482 n=1 Tax=Actinidia eriantha TaxID=165200 RepID=UPI00258E12B3|nr:uncharacterized protein LOC130755482 [Actinidia eriantha]